MMRTPAVLARPPMLVGTAAAEAPWSSSRHVLVACFALVCLLGAAITRAALILKALAAGQVAPEALPAVVAIGAAYDLIAALYVSLPFTIYLMLLPERLYRSRLHRAVTWAGMYLAAFGICYLVAVEFFYFDEFNARFNFIAVEYLIYPHEVFVNIWESYPVGRALAAAALIAAALTFRLRPWIAHALRARSSVRARFTTAVAALGLAALAFSFIDGGAGRLAGDRIASELAANGIYSFFSAAASSRLDYREYYATVDEDEAARRVRRLVKQPNASFIAGARNPLARHVHYPGAPKLLNVIVLLEESLGAEFIGAYGAPRSLTPNLDRIAEESLVFTRTYATGTRTVRGMEAVTASFPPVPAESIVKRPHNEGMFNWSQVMQRNGYQPTFIYGGYGTFDNMNYFFGHNGYRVVDRSMMDAPRFSNIWGVSDEDLFRNALRVFDQQHARGERIFSVVMTTSNHKPFTFPDGIAGVRPRGGGRESGVRYADYAIGEFVRELRQRPYSDDTLVVIVADHGARVYGREDIPLPTYAIPFIVYSPRHIPPRRVATLASQIDVAPTVLGLLNLSHDSVFFGKDVLADSSVTRFAPLNHNRDVGLFGDGRLNELGFRGAQRTLTYDASTRQQVPTAADSDGLRDAASVFQLAYTLYSRQGYRLE